MPERPRSHQLEVESRLAFESELPSNWVFREKIPDYGIDGEVEVFDEGNNATGILFYVQLKATDEKDITKVKKVLLSVDTLKYYCSLNYPVLIVRYSSFHKKQFWRWTHSKLKRLPSRKQKTFTFHFEDQDELDAARIQKIRKDAKDWLDLRNKKLKFPLTINVLVDGLSDREFSESEFVRCASLIAGNGGDELVIFTFKPTPESFGTLCLRKKESRLTIGGDCASSPFESIVKFRNDYIPFIAKVYLLSGSLLHHYKYESLANDLILAAYQYTEILKQSPELLAGVVLSLYLTRSYDALKKVLKQTMTAENAVGVQGVTSILYHLSTRREPEEMVYIAELLTMVRDFLRDEKAPSEVIGTAEYNLGNIHRAMRSNRLAVRHYHAAIRLAPDYSERPYFWGELAGVLFLERRYVKAAEYYGRALALNPGDSATVGLYADALLFAGSFEESLRQFRRYLELAEEQEAIWFLTYICLSRLPDDYLKDAGRSPTAAAKKLARFPPKPSERFLEEIIITDLCCSDAWHKLGERHVKSKKLKAALMSFLWAGVLGSVDVAPWSNAYFLAIQAKEEKLALPIFVAGFEKWGPHFISCMFAAIDQNMPVEEREKIKQAILAQKGEVEKMRTKAPMLIRFLDSDIPPMELY